jgi:2-keto-3-deoxy-L-rhamnonate aldolase RhmA
MRPEVRMPATQLKDRLRNGDVVLGTILPLPSPEVAEIIGLAGYDCVLLDAEHGPLTHETLQAMARACRSVGAAPLVRVPDHHPKQILRALDCGCVGVMAPQVETAEQAAAVVAATRYAPQGIRSLAGATPAARWGAVPLAEHVARSNASAVSVLQVETRRGLASVEEIARVPGVDVLFVGPADLSQSLGHPGETGHPDVQAAFRRIIEAGRAAGVAVGILALTPGDVRGYRRLGVTMFLDSAPRLLLRASQAQAAGMREAAADAGSGDAR